MKSDASYCIYAPLLMAKVSQLEELKPLTATPTTAAKYLWRYQHVYGAYAPCRVKPMF